MNEFESTLKEKKKYCLAQLDIDADYVPKGYDILFSKLLKSGCLDILTSPNQYEQTLTEKLYWMLKTREVKQIIESSHAKGIKADIKFRELAKFKGGEQNFKTAERELRRCSNEPFESIFTSQVLLFLLLHYVIPRNKYRSKYMEAYAQYYCTVIQGESTLGCEKALQNIIETASADGKFTIDHTEFRLGELCQKKLNNLHETTATRSIGPRKAVKYTSRYHVMNCLRWSPDASGFGWLVKAKYAGNRLTSDKSMLGCFIKLTNIDTKNLATANAMISFREMYMSRDYLIKEYVNSDESDYLSSRNISHKVLDGTTPAEKIFTLTSDLLAKSRIRLKAKKSSGKIQSDMSDSIKKRDYSKLVINIPDVELCTSLAWAASGKQSLPEIRRRATNNTPGNEVKILSSAYNNYYGMLLASVLCSRKNICFNIIDSNRYSDRWLPSGEQSLLN